MVNPNITGAIQTQLDVAEQDAEELVRIRFRDGSVVEISPKTRAVIPQTFSMQEVKVNIDVGLGQLDTQFFDELLVGSTVDILYRFRQTQDTIRLFSGEIDGASASNEGVGLQVVGLEALLSEELPRRTFTRTCNYQHYDEWCGVNRADFLVPGTISVVGAMQFQSSAIVGTTTNWFQLGVAWIPTFAVGSTAGLAYSVKGNTGSVVRLMRPLRPTPSIGDAFQIYAGCDKTFSTCKNKFDNAVNFGGFRFVPRPESITGIR